jgi:hypothetical protein
MIECLQAFEQWFTANGGRLFDGVELVHNEDRGVHVRVKKGSAVAADTQICICPASLSFSCLNALASARHAESRTPWPAMAASLPPEPVGWFYLVHEFLQGSNSFWKPYMDVLPKIGQLSTLMYFSEDDLAWLGGTNLLAAYWQRTSAWQEYWKEGLGIIQKSGWPHERYTW